MPIINYNHISTGLRGLEKDILDILVSHSINKLSINEIETIAKLIADAANKQLALAITKSQDPQKPA